MSVATKSRKAKLTVSEANVSEASVSEAILDVSIGKATDPAPTAPTDPAPTAPTDPAPTDPAPTDPAPTDPAQNLQEAIAKENPPAPTVSADDVATIQIRCFDRAIGRAKVLAFSENRTTVDIGSDLQEAIDSFKSIIAKSEWWRQRADTINDYETRFRLKMNGRSARAYAALNCYHVHRLASDESKGLIIDGLSGRPFPIATLETIGTWVNYSKADDSYEIKAGYESHFDAIIRRVADEGLTASDTEKAMKATEAIVRLSQAEANGGANDKAKEEKNQRAKAKADRSKAIDKATDSFAKSLASDKIGGVSASEVLNELSKRGLADVSGLVDPATMTPNDGLAFASRLCELDRADVIFVMLQRFRQYEQEAIANAQKASAPKPALNDAPEANGKASANGKATV
jgi:hypothetical protein